MKRVASRTAGCERAYGDTHAVDHGERRLRLSAEGFSDLAGFLASTRLLIGYKAEEPAIDAARHGKRQSTF